MSFKQNQYFQNITSKLYKVCTITTSHYLRQKVKQKSLTKYEI